MEGLIDGIVYAKGEASFACQHIKDHKYVYWTPYNGDSAHIWYGSFINGQKEGKFETWWVISRKDLYSKMMYPFCETFTYVHGISEKIL